MPRPTSARARLVITPDAAARDPETEGENEPRVPDPEMDAEVVVPRADLNRRPLPPGPPRAVPREPEVNCASDWDEAPDMPRPTSARAPLAITPDAAALVPDPETDGENEPLVPEPETAEKVLAPRAEPLTWLVELPGLFRADPRAPVAACANDWDDTPDIMRPASARAPLAITPVAAARDPDTDGENEPLVPEPETVEEVLAPRAEPLA